MAIRKSTARKSGPAKSARLVTTPRSLLDFLFTGKNGPAVVASPSDKGAAVLFRAKGRMSHFGGPKDMGMRPEEGLAVFLNEDLTHPHHKGLFLDKAPRGTSGLGRRLNPEAFYIACRWDYATTSRALLRTVEVTVTNSATGKSLNARPVDWGPHEKTGRIADLSPGLEQALGLTTDAICEVTLAVGVMKPGTFIPKSPTDGMDEVGIVAIGAFHPPVIFSCQDWSAIAAKRTEFARNPAVGIVIHHTEGANREPLSGKAEKIESFATARSIQRSHFERGWSDTGQHFTISQGGLIMEGRHGSLAAAANGECVQAAHAGNTEKNEKWFGIEICGDNRKDYHVTQQQWAAVVDLCAWLCDARGGADLALIGHGEVHTTSCPGMLMDRLEDLRRAISARRSATSDVPENQPFFRDFKNLFKSRSNDLPRRKIRSLGLARASSLTVKSAAAEETHAQFVAAKFIWRYHLDPIVRDQLDPAHPDWLVCMLDIKMKMTLLVPLPGTPSGIATARARTSAATLIGICLHPEAEGAKLEPGISRSDAVSHLASVSLTPSKSVAQYAAVLDAAIRFP